MGTRLDSIRTVAAWLTDHGHTVQGVCTLQIYKGTPNHESLLAVKYVTPDRGEQARYYVAGFRPDVPRPNRTCYVIDGKTFFVATYADTTNEHAPHGPFFVLMEWTSTDPIDANSPRNTKPYDRIPLVESKYVLDNLSMERALTNGKCLDVSACDRNSDDDYILRSELRDAAVAQDERNRGDTDFCDAVKEVWIGSIGLCEASQVVLASVSGKFYQRPGFNCLFLR